MSADVIRADESIAHSTLSGVTGPVLPKVLQKALTGISGFDELTFGGLPAGRPTLICGAAGSGKTLFAMTFLLNGILRFGERGVLVSFEERVSDMVANCASLGYDLNAMMTSGDLLIDHVRIERSEIQEAGEYGLDGLFIRLGYAIESTGARRVVIDTIEALFSAFSDVSVLRAEIRRLFGWIKDHGLTAIITAESGEGELTRHGLEEYVSDCVIVLDNRVHDEIATRRLRVVKYRGSTHGTNEYPFLIDSEGISVLPVTSQPTAYPVSQESISTGIAGLDAMLQGRGYFRGSSILLSGVAGTGKTTIASKFIDAACARGENCMFFLFEETVGAVCRNLRSVGLDLQHRADSGLLRFEEARPSLYGLEMHLARLYRDLNVFRPTVVVVDPISAFRGPNAEVHTVLLRMVDMLKTRGITALFTSLRNANAPREGTEQGLASVMDTWIELRELEQNGETDRMLHIVKSRGIRHSNQIREYRITDTGIELVDVYVGPQGVLTGTARETQQAREQANLRVKQQNAARRRRAVGRRREAPEGDATDEETRPREAAVSEAALASPAIAASRPGAAK
jgi:circadian clock protein KaiC